ncbi:MAG: VOC family protein [Roseiflexaceae bacterium]
MHAQSSQSGTIPNRSMPPGTIIPELVYGDLAAAVTWLCTTFGFKERLRIGNHRSQLIFGAASVIVVALPDGVSQPSQANHSLMVRVEDLDRHYAHVSQSGARIISPPTDFPYGERQYTAEDLAGRRWTFSQSIADIDPQEWGGRLLERADDLN